MQHPARFASDKRRFWLFGCVISALTAKIGVSIERYIWLLLATVVGMCVFVLMVHIGELRSPGNRVPL